MVRSPASARWPDTTTGSRSRSITSWPPSAPATTWAAPSVRSGLRWRPRTVPRTRYRRTPRGLHRLGPVPVATRAGTARSRAIAGSRKKTRTPHRSRSRRIGWDRVAPPLHGGAKCHVPESERPVSRRTSSCLVGKTTPRKRPSLAHRLLAIDCCRPGPDKIGMLTMARCERRECPGVARGRHGGEWTRQWGEMAEGGATG
jgi:hypothetical protein